MFNFVIRMARQQFLGYFTCVCVMMIFLMHLTSAERPTFSMRESGYSKTMFAPQTQNEMISKSHLTPNGEHASSSMLPINYEISWLRGLENFSKRVFQLAQDEQHWPVLKLNQLRTILGIVLGGIGAGLSSAGGLGGGGLFVPLLNLMLQFDTKTSAALSNFMILGGSIVNLWINLRQHHPKRKHLPVIDFDVLLLMQPNMLLGISIGVILNVVLPAWIITAALALVLGYMTLSSVKGGLKRWDRETQQNLARKKALEAPPVLISADTDEGGVAAEPKISSERMDRENGLTKPLLYSGAPKLQLYPMKKIGALALVWFAFSSVQVLRGGKGGQSILGINQCGWGYWFLTSTQLPLALMMTAWTISQLRQSHGVPSKDHKEYNIQEEGYVLGPEAGTIFPWMALIAGVLGGMLGIGGGMIINPMLFAVGMLPQVTAATCASMVFFSSSMSVLQYWLMGRIPVKYAVISAVLCGVFSWFGIVIVHKAIDKYNRASLIVFSVAAVMGVSTVLMCGFGGWDLFQQYEGGAYMGFHYPC